MKPLPCFLNGMERLRGGVLRPNWIDRGDVEMEPTAQLCTNRPHQQFLPFADIPELFGYAIALLF